MSKKLKATHEGELRIGETILQVAVLDDETRIINQSAIFKAFDRPMRGSRHATDQSFDKNAELSAKLPALIDAKNLKPFINSELLDVIKVVEYQNLAGKIVSGYDAIILPLICEVYIKANEAKKPNGKSVLTKKQQANYTASKMLMRSLYKVSIISLVDEVTKYQYERSTDALQTFLNKFLEQEKGKWVRTFDPDFFEAIFKMKDWTWNQASTKKPQVVGHYINNYVYSRLAPKILAELKALNPKDEKGNRKGKHPQWINPEFGHPKLKEHIAVLTAFAKATGYNWNNWNRMVERALPKFNKDGSINQEIDFPEGD